MATERFQDEVELTPTQQSSYKDHPEDKYTDDPDQLEFGEGVAPISLRQRRTHSRLSSLAWITLLVAAVFGILGAYWKGGQDAVKGSASETEAPPPATSPPEAPAPSPAEATPAEAPSSPTEAPTEENAPLIGGNTDYAHFTRVQKQIENFKNGQGIILNFLIVHHGGTTVCKELGWSLRHPSYACLRPTAEDGVGPDYPVSFPWTHDDTAHNIEIVRKNFQLLTWNLGFPAVDPSIPDTDWENPNLVSLLVIREPINRALGDGMLGQHYPNIHRGNATKEEWWNFSRDIRSNNFALKILTDYNCCDGVNTSPHYLDQAKEMVQRFTFILDINCLEHSLDKLAEILGIQLKHDNASEDFNHDHRPAKERIPFPEVYDFMAENNKLDIELYEWAKTLSIVNCDAVYREEAAKEKEEAALEEEKHKEEESKVEEEAAAAAAEEKPGEGNSPPGP